MADTELRLYKPGTEVESRYGAVQEQYHTEDTDVEMLKRGHYSAHDQSQLDAEQLKYQKESQELWGANHTFLWDWDGISAKVKKLAKHRNLNVVTTGIVQQYHALIAPPLTARCGHRCTYARSQLACRTHRSMKYVDQYQGTYYGTGTRFPEGITPSNIDEILKDMNRAPEERARCCRCVNADAWFGLQAKSHGTYSDFKVHGVLAKAIVNDRGHVEKCHHLKLEKGEWYAETDSLGYYAPIISERTINGNLDTEHIGWHAGLLRPRFNFRERNYDSGLSGIEAYTSYRPQWFSKVRLADQTSVISGLHNPKRYLCPNCFTAAKGLSPHLYWVARGYTFKEARLRQQREFEVWQKGKTKRWLQNTSIHIKDWARFPHAYGI